MPPIAIGPVCSVNCAKPVAGSAASLAERRKADEVRAATTDRSPNAVARHELLDPGPEPVDAERVASIRKAIETGTYPLVPATVADAFIAAGYLLRAGR